jgi:DNA-binding response OmpR family regulator
MDPAKPESRPILPRAAVPLDSAGRLKALVVDGDDASRAFAAEALHSFAPGFDVATARDPQQALAWIETFSPDLLVTDLRFSPGALGSLRERLRAVEPARRCRVLVVSSLPSDDPLVESARLESDAVLIKPIGLPYLLEIVRKVMRHEQSH